MAGGDFAERCSAFVRLLVHRAQPFQKSLRGTVSNVSLFWVLTRCPALLVVGDNSPAVEAVVRIREVFPHDIGPTNLLANLPHPAVLSPCPELVTEGGSVPSSLLDPGD